MMYKIASIVMSIIFILLSMIQPGFLLGLVWSGSLWYRGDD